jgi:hypothetical protein
VAYIGRPSIVGNFVKLDAISVVNGQAAYTMQNGSANFTDYSTVNQFMVSLNGTIQSPGSSFTVSGSTITFASNLVTNDVIDFIIVFGNSLSSGVPTDATVSTAKLVDANVTTAKVADDAITAAKINNDIISGSTELASEPADTDEFLVSDAGTLKRIDYSLIKGGLAHLSTTNFSGSSSNVEISLDYSAHENFLLVCDYLEGSSTGSGENCDVHFKRDGESSFDTGGSDYGFGGQLHDSSTNYNVNTGDAMEIFRGQEPAFEHLFIANITGVGNTTSYGAMFVQQVKLDTASPGQSSGNINNVYYKTDRVVAMRFSFTAGTVTKLQAKLYGYVE